MSFDPQALAPEKRFLPAFGRAALILPAVGIVGAIVGAMVLNGVEAALVAGAVGGEEDAAIVFYLRILVLGVAVLAGFAGFVLGLLSLFGKGQVNGTSSPILGIFGMLLGALVTCMPLLLLPAIQAAKQARVVAMIKEMDSGAEQLRCAGGAVVLVRPDEGWAIVDGEKARSFNPLASVAALRALPNQKLAIGMIIAEPITFVDLGILHESQLPDALPAVAENLVEQARLFDKTKPSLRTCTLGEIEGLEVMYEGTSPEGIDVSVRQQLYWWRGYMVRFVMTLPDDPSGEAKALAEPFFRAVTLVE